MRALALFSGGLDSILASRLVMLQGIEVLGLHFFTPFFGQAEPLPVWSKEYGLRVDCIDIGQDFIDMLSAYPVHGFGKVLNPCVDCKILMMRKAKELLDKYNADFIISGEVLGQRPMSQRRDSLDVVLKQAGVRDYLVRPLSALHLKPSKPELDGLIEREKLGKLFGRGRKEQMRLAREFGIVTIPTPAGGCKLAERENAKRYMPVLRYTQATVHDFYLSNIGRQAWLWQDRPYWLSIGRNEADNQTLLKLAQAEDIILKMATVPGPLALLRGGENWPEPVVASAASYMSSYATKATAGLTPGELVQVHIIDTDRIFEVSPQRESLWSEMSWDRTKEEIIALRPQEND